MPQRFRLYVLAPSLAAIAVCGFQLYQLTQQQQLWGWWPLPLLLGLWGVVVALRQNLSRLQLLGIATLSGVAMGVGFGPLPLWPLLVLGFAGLLYLTNRLATSSLSIKQQWWYSYHTLLLYNIGATWWVANTALAAGVVANFLNALLMAVPWALIYLVRKRMPSIWLPAAVVLWLGFEWLHYNWQIAWPWLAFGNSLATTPALIQWYEFTGTFGGSLLICTLGVLLYQLLVLEAKRRAAIALAVGSLIPVLASLFMLLRHQLRSAENAVVVTAIQPNYEPHYRKFEISPTQQIDETFALVEQAPASSLYVLPETSFGSSYDEATLRGGQLEAYWSSFRQNLTSPAGLLVGLSTYRRYAKPIENPALRVRESPRGTSYYTMHNAAAALEGEGSAQVYHKSKLVPGVEFLPYRKALFLFEPLVESLGGTTAGLGTSDTAMVMNFGASGIRAAPLICYESIYGDYVREFVLSGANLLTVPTNDGWWDDSPGHLQHLQFASLRAIETRRWVVQAANSGVSAFVDPAGRVVARTAYDEASYLSEGIALLEEQTFYTRYGDILGRLAAGMSVLVLLSLLAITLRRGASAS